MHLAQTRDSWIKQVLTTTGLNTVNELRGIPSIGETLAPSARKSMMRSQSFGQKVKDIKTLGEAICYFVARAAESLRKEGLVTASVAVHIRTSRFDTRHETFETNGQKTLLYPCADTGLLQRTALTILDAIFKDGPESPRQAFYSWGWNRLGTTARFVARSGGAQGAPQGLDDCSRQDQRQTQGAVEIWRRGHVHQRLAGKTRAPVTAIHNALGRFASGEVLKMQTSLCRSEN